jgi:hypothetical protein
MSGTERNPNIGALGRAEYQPGNKRVKGFSPFVACSADQYIAYLRSNVMPVAEASAGDGASRVIDRTVAKNGVFEIGGNLGDTGLKVEALVPLGGRWEGHSWVMSGVNYPGRILSETTMQEILNLARDASNVPYEEATLRHEGFTIDIVRQNGGFSQTDLMTLADIFRASFTHYISDLSTPKKVNEWAQQESTYPIVVRNPEGKIVVVTNGDCAEINLSGKPFKFLEIGDSASDPAYRSMGLNRYLKALLIREGKNMGFDSIHAETRAAWGSPNFGNAKNGMSYCGTLPLNCVIGGIEDVQETKDPQISDTHRRFGSLNVWAITPSNPNWTNY